MKAKSVVLFLWFLLVLSAEAQNQDKVIGVHHEIKLAMEDKNPEMIAQVTQGDKPGVQILTCYNADEEGSLMQMIKLSENDSIFWIVEYTGVYYDADASFHFIITGPEFFYYPTDFFEAKYKNYYYTALETNNNWKKGTYTMTVIAELEKNRAGSACVGSCRVRLY